MKLEKIKKTYNDYDIELSWGQIEAIASALEQNHNDPLSDELYAELKWYMGQVAGPGEDQDALDAQKKAAEGGGAEGGVPGEAEGDDLPIPMPPGEQAGTPPEGEEPPFPPEPGDEAPAGGAGEAERGLPEIDFEGEGAPVGAEEEPPTPAKETDRRLPRPPRE